jgi:hypothetical protein
MPSPSESFLGAGDVPIGGVSKRASEAAGILLRLLLANQFTQVCIKRDRSMVR